MLDKSLKYWEKNPRDWINVQEIYWKTPYSSRFSAKLSSTKRQVFKPRHHGNLPGSNLCATARPGTIKKHGPLEMFG